MKSDQSWPENEMQKDQVILGQLLKEGVMILEVYMEVLNEALYILD